MAKQQMVIDGIDVKISNPDKVIFPDDGITKLQLIEYYRRIAPTMLPHISGRPLTLVRYVDGIQKQGFFQKGVSDYFPEWLDRVTVDKEGGSVTHPLALKPATLVYLANQAAVTLHVWTSRVPDLHRPDVVVFDLDPADAKFAVVRGAARRVRVLLQDVGLVPYIQTTGSKGLHVVAPIAPALGFERVATFAHEAATVIAQDSPEKYTTEFRIAKRAGRLFIDTRRNAYAQTFAAPYTVRPKPGAPIATPFTWDELTRVTSQRWNMRNIFRRLSSKGDAWANMERDAGDLEKAMRRLTTSRR